MVGEKKFLSTLTGRKPQCKIFFEIVSFFESRRKSRRPFAVPRKEACCCGRERQPEDRITGHCACFHHPPSVPAWRTQRGDDARVPRHPREAGIFYASGAATGGRIAGPGVISGQTSADRRLFQRGPSIAEKRSRRRRAASIPTS